MTEVVRACVAALIVVALAGPVSAVGRTVGPKRPQPTLAKFVSDLTGASSAKRALAGRTLLSQVKRARKDAARWPEGDLVRAEALARLTDFDQLVAPACARELRIPEVTSACAEILGLLETRSALPKLEAQLAVEERRRVRRRLAQAIKRIKQATP
jgi:HEAT repeat protein